MLDIYGISGFETMTSLPNITFVITILITAISFITNKENEHIMKHIILALSIIGFIIHFIHLYILGLRLFRQTKTNLFGTDTIFKLILSNILSFTNIYYSLYLFDKDSFYISKNDYKDINSKYHYPKLHFIFLYFSVYTFFTQGYGDVYPDNVKSRSLAIIQMIMTYIDTAYIFSKVMSYI